MSSPPKENWSDVSLTGEIRGREDTQPYWHLFVGSLFVNYDILDVGAGLGYSKERLSRNGLNRVFLQDTAPGLHVDINTPLEQIPDNSYDVITCFDVIEHVLYDVDFVEQLKRISRKFVFISTPNYNVSKAGSPFHCREYTPEQLVVFGKGSGVRYFAGGCHGENIRELNLNDFTLFPGHPSFVKHEEHIGILIVKEQREFRKDRFSIVLPTVGRETLPRMMRSILTQELLEGDELVVVADGNEGKVRDLVEPMMKEFPKVEIRIIAFPESHKDYGHTPRNKVMSLLMGEYCIHVDDDDLMAKNAIKRIREDIKSGSDVYLYRMFLMMDGDYVWKDKHFGYMNFGTPCIVHRLDYGSYGVFSLYIGGDWDFIRTTGSINKVERKESFIGIIRPDDCIG